ncbi:MAG: winged helix-turn-helix domain-containing protein [Blastocatellia bacterium]
MIPQDNHLYEFEPFLLNAGSRILLKDGVLVRLTPKALETLLVLVQHALEVVDKEHLLKEVWPDSFVEEGSLSYNIYELRKALGDDSSEPRYIETIPKRGYRFVAPVKVVNARQIGFPGVEGDATVIEKHTFARVISKEIEGTDLPAAPLSHVAGVDALALPGASSQLKKPASRAAAVAAVLLLAAIGFFAYLKSARVSPAPISHAKSTLVRLTSNNAMDGAPIWSPDGSKIAFWSNRDGKKEIYVMDADGSIVKRLTNNLADEDNPKWSPDGRKILFDSERDANIDLCNGRRGRHPNSAHQEQCV